MLAKPQRLPTLEPEGNHRLVSSAWSDCGGGNANTDRPGVNELRIKAGDKDNDATADLPGPHATSPCPGCRAHPAQHPGSEATSRSVIVYQQHVFGNRSFSTIFTEGMAERLAPNDWLK